MSNILKIQLISDTQTPQTTVCKENEKITFLTYHASTDEEKARVLETIVDNQGSRYRVTREDDGVEARTDQWYEHIEEI